MEWVYEQLTSAFFTYMIGKAEEGTKPATNQFVVKNQKTKRSGGYKEITGTIVINFGNYEGYIERWTNDLATLVGSCVALGDESLDEETGVLEVSFNVIVNKTVK